jgi:hypothetical protein
VSKLRLLSPTSVEALAGLAFTTRLKPPLRVSKLFSEPTGHRAGIVLQSGALDWCRRKITYHEETDTIAYYPVDFPDDSLLAPGDAEPGSAFGSAGGWPASDDGCGPTIAGRSNHCARAARADSGVSRYAWPPQACAV